MKKIIVCCDGTWNKPGNTDRGQPVETNVEKIYKAVQTEKTSMQQVKFYGPGVGTSFAITEQLVGGGTGMGIDRNIQDAYKFLMWSYEPGDEMYLFGFSRGAYTVRSLGGLVRNCGIMKPDYMHLIPDAYALYRDRTELTHPDSDTMKAFRKSYSIESDTAIKFMGVWDTVGSLGIPIPWFNWWNRKYQFHDVKLSTQIKFAYQALALDEKRRVFRPTLWEVSDPDERERMGGICEQVWFSGAHANVGGGFVDCGLSNIALKWMIDKARDTGLEFDENYVNEQVCNSQGELRASVSIFYRVLGIFVRAIDDIQGKADSTKRKIRNERVHYTCVERMHLVKKYKPKNLLNVLRNGIQFDPDQAKWQPEWLKYYADLANPATTTDKRKMEENLA
jgi:uncharacterized protein (DUF2235 family)